MSAQSSSCSQTRSKVWEYFSKDDKENIKCKTCEVVIKVKDGSTTNLHNHLKRKHNISVQTCPPKSKKLTADSSDGASSSSSSHQSTLLTTWTKLSRDSQRSKAITEAIAKHIVIDTRPLDIVNDLGFVQLIKTLEPRYDLASRTYITQTMIPNMYMKVRDQVMAILRKAEFVSLTTDGWSSRAAKGYVTVTAHVMTDRWKLEDFVLCTSEIEESHTADNLATQLMDTAKDWHIDLSHSTVTTDNAANIVLAVEKCKVLCHVRCMAHVLNLSTQKGLKSNAVARLLGRVRSVVGFFHRSPTASSILRKTLTQLELPQLKPVMDVVTRWNSTHDMLKRYLELRPAICAALSHKDLRANSQKDTLSPQDVADIEAIRDVSVLMLCFA